jgi:hypothetical protein
MTDLLMPEDTGDIAETRVIFHQTVDTAVIRLAEGPTRRLTAPPPPPLQALRLANAHPHETGEIPAWPTGAELAVAGRPTHPEPSRPAGYRGTRRMPHSPAPRWAVAAITYGSGVISGALGVLAWAAVAVAS